MAEGFLGRWAQRKLDARQGKPLTEPEAPRVATPAPQPVPTVAPPDTPADMPPYAPADAQADAAPLTLQDAQALDRDSDFKPFIARSVDPAVRNAAMKKLFADPHYNVMDGLDTYIDDYSQPDPLPLSMLQKMVSAQFLNLVDEEPASPKAADASVDPVPRADATPLTPLASNAAPAETTTTITRDNHADTDLRLQQDHAPGSPDAGPGTQ
jgi:hypothetical protein